MTMNLRTATRTSRAQVIVNDCGANAKLKLYNGTRPSGVNAIVGGNTLLASGAFGAVIGVATAAAVDFDEAGFTQTSSGFVAGTPTFADLTTSADVIITRIDIAAGVGNWQFSGAVVNGQNLTLTALLLPEGNA